jgi:O-antigen/teichoic acid export membrane protein
MMLAALIPLVQSPEGVASSALMVRGRYDLRAGYLAFSMALRLAGLAAGAHFGVTQAVIGIVLAQTIATVTLGAAAMVAFRRFPAAAHQTLAADRRGIFSFVLQSSIATGILSLRGALTPLLLGMVANPVEVGFFRVAQAPQAGFTALTSPVRLILLAEQTRDWERGATDVVFAGIRRYTLGAAALVAVALPPLYVFMPQIVHALYGEKYAGATDAARLILLAGAVLLLTGWSKSFPVSIGRPGLRILAHGIETAVLVPLVLLFGDLWGATGAAGAVLAASVVFSIVWGVLVVRIARAHQTLPPDPSAQTREALT